MTNRSEFEDGNKVFRITTKEMAQTPVSPLLCSNFIEEGFGYQVEGMWSEMLFNRSFEKMYQVLPSTYDWFGGRNAVGNDWSIQPWYHSSYAHNRWYACPGQDLPVSMAPDSSYLTPKAANYAMNLEYIDGGIHGETSLLIDNDDEVMVGVAQNGKYLNKGAKYEFSGYLKCIEGNAAAEIRLYEDKDPIVWDAPLAVMPLGEISTEGGMYKAVIENADYEGWGTFALFVSPMCKVQADAFSLMPAETIHGWRPDVVRDLKRIKPGVIRYPGGCFASFHDWRWAIGDRNTRIPEPSYFWGGVNYNDVGTDEFLTLCEDIGAEPMLVVNVFHPTKGKYLQADPEWLEYQNANADKFTSLDKSGRKTIRKTPHGFELTHCVDIEAGIECAAKWVEYCNGSIDTPMGALRAANGHPEPYGVKYWEMDNEWFRWGNFEEYSRLLIRYSKAMKAVDPSICIGMTSYHIYKFHVDEMLAICGEHIDFLADRVCEADNLANKLDSIRRWNAAHEHQIFYTDTEALQNRDPKAPESIVKYYEEHGINIRTARRTWIYALSLVSNLMMDMRYGGEVRFMCFNNLANTTGQSCLETPREGSLLSFCGLIYERMSRCEAAWPLEIEGYAPTNRKEIEIQAAWDLNREKMILILLNRSEEDTKVTLDLSGLGKRFTSFTSCRMSAENGAVEETAKSQGNCKYEYSEGAVAEHGMMLFDIPNFSFTEVVLA